MADKFGSGFRARYRLAAGNLPDRLAAFSTGWG
jgi:hypothetical protein